MAQLFTGSQCEWADRVDEGVLIVDDDDITNPHVEQRRHHVDEFTSSDASRSTGGHEVIRHDTSGGDDRRRGSIARHKKWCSEQDEPEHQPGNSPCVRRTLHHCDSYR